MEGIAVPRRVTTLYILHAAQWCHARIGVPEGTTVAKYLVHYADGSEACIPVVCGEDVRDWWSVGGNLPVTRGQVAWTGRNPAATEKGLHIRLFLTAWENPHPEKTVAGIDYVSAMSVAAPFCIAVTAEEPVPTSVSRPDPSSKPRP